MLSTVPPSGVTNHSTVKRPTLFLSPYSVTSTNSTNGRLPSTPSSSPLLRPKLQLQQQSTTSSTFSTTNPHIGGCETPGASSPVSEVRIAVLGLLGVGKSALVVKYITRRFIQEYDPYLEDIYGRTDTADGRTLCVRIMDTSDLPGKRPERYLKWANGFIVAYSIVCRDSYDEAARYLEQLRKLHRLTASETPVVLVGNKADLERYRTVSRSAGEGLASKYDCAYFETSASEDFASVSAAFGRLLVDVVHMADRQPALQSLYITEDRYKTPTAKLSPGVTPPTDSDRKDDAKQQLTSRRSTTGFKLFNKGFKIFN